MKKELKDLTIQDIWNICQKGCDDCPRALVNQCQYTGYMLFNIEPTNDIIELDDNQKCLPEKSTD